jgi:transposase
VRLRAEARRDLETRQGALTRISTQLRINSETLRIWVKRAEIDAGDRPGITTDNAGWSAKSGSFGANAILKSASAFFATELDRLSADNEIHRRA